MKNNIMNININIKLALSVASASLLLTNIPAAQAQQRGGARFNFAPNVYPIEQSRIPEVSSHQPPDEVHSVRSGHVPSSRDILGLDPGSLPVAPSIAQTQARLMQSPPAHYQESFGSPNNALAALPKTLAPLGLPKAGDRSNSADKAVHAQLMHAKNNHLVNTKVAGKLLRKNHSAGQAGQVLALKPASYASNFGYEPGPTAPAAYGNGMTVKQDVTGKLLHRGR